MVPLASFMCMAQTSFFAQNFAQDSAGYTLMVLCTLLAFPAGFLLLARSEYPEATFWIACALVVVFPYDSLIALMAMTSLLARRSNRNTTIRATVGGTIVTLISQLRDALQQPKASIWHLIFAQPHTGGDSGSPMVMLVEEPTVIITATVASLVFVTIATLIGLHIRSRARLRTANAVASAATTHAATLQTDLTNQQLADAIAAEAHDTLAHSLSLMALNASALKAEAAKLGDSPEAQSLADKAEDIRRQSAGALDEAHSIIDMLRNPHQAWEQLAPSDDTSLTRESLDALIADTRNSGTSLNTWIDIQQLSVMDESIGKVAYRAIQEGLTNAAAARARSAGVVGGLRHAAGGRTYPYQQSDRQRMRPRRSGPMGPDCLVWQRACTRSTGNAGMGWTIGTCSMSTCNCLGAAKMASVSEKNGNSVSGGKPERGGLTGSGTGLEPKPIRVSVIDDDPMICQAMSLILNDYSHGRIEVVSTSTDGETCVRRAAEEKPDVVLMDIAMPGVDGIEATRLLRSLSPAPHVLILTSLSPSGTVERAVEAGAEGFVSKTDAADDIIRRIIGVCEGAPQFNTASQKQLIDDLSVTRPRSRRDEARALLDALPDREREAVMLAAEGYTNAEIASRMFISERTAKAHLSSAANKLDMGRVQMARLVERADLPARL